MNIKQAQFPKIHLVKSKYDSIDRKFELEGTLSVIFSIKKYRLQFCVPNVLYSYDH